PHGEQARSAGRVAALARLHEHHREHDGHGASRHPQREALEFAFDGPTLDCRGHARSQEGLSKAQSLQATSGLTSRPCCALRKGNKPPSRCPKGEGRLTSITAALALQSSTEHGAIPIISGRLGYIHHWDLRSALGNHRRVCERKGTER